MSDPPREPATVLADPVEETRRILHAADAAKLALRAIGGIGVALRAPSIQALRPTRTYHDIDLVGPAERRPIERLMEHLGYEGAHRFNTLNGAERLLFHDPDGRRIDVFVDTLRMCHDLPFTGRLTVDRWTLPLADLVLTKLQIVKLTERDVLDLCALFADHDLDPVGDGGISVPRLVEVCASDWGWWRTVDGNLAHLVERWTGTSDALHARAADRATSLRRILGSAPKSTRWKARALIGSRIAWAQAPEDIR